MSIEKFSKRPVEIDAVQLTLQNVAEVYSFVYGGFPLTGGYVQGEKWQDYIQIVKENGMVIPTLEDGKNCEAKHIASVGDWIIKGVEGEFYPCKPSIFEKTYIKSK